MTTTSEHTATLQAENERLRQRVAELEHEREQAQTRTKNHDILQYIIDNSLSVIYAKDIEGRYLLVNRQAAALINKTPADILGKTDAELLPPDVAARFQDGDMHVKKTRRIFEREETLTLGDFSETYLSQGFPIFDAQGNFYAVAGIGTNITRLKQTEQQLRESEAQNQALLDAIPDLMFRITRDGVFVAYKAEHDNDMVAPPEVFLGKRMHDVLPEEIATNSLQRVVQALETGEVQTYEYMLPMQDGMRSFEGRYSVCGENEVILLIRDITERKQAERELHAFKTLVDRAPDGIAVATDGKISYANDAYNQLLGYDSSIGMTNKEFTPPEEHHRIPEILAHLQKYGSWQGTYRCQSKDRNTFLSSMSVFALLSSDDQTDTYDLSVLGAIMRDLTRQQEEEAERAALQQQVIDVQQAAIRELSTPLIPLSPTVVMLPLIGAIDSRRAQMVIETLLEGIAAHQAETAILDITGVAVVDTQVANALIQAAQAVRLLGAQVIITGIGPAMAQTLVHLGTDLHSIQTRGSLQQAVADALRMS